MNKLLILLWLVAVPGLAALPPANPVGSADNSQFYYQIGGATSIIQASNVNMATLPLSGSIDLGLGYSCGKFDPFISFTNAINQISNFTRTIQSAVTAAISSLPLLILQRVSPGLYDLFQNLSIKAEAIVALANQSCEAMEREIKKGNNPYEAWTDLSKSIDWKVQMKSGSRDVTLAKKMWKRIMVGTVCPGLGELVLVGRPKRPSKLPAMWCKQVTTYTLIGL